MLCQHIFSVPLLLTDLDYETKQTNSARHGEMYLCYAFMAQALKRLQHRTRC